MPAPLPRRLIARAPGRIHPSLEQAAEALESLRRPHDAYPSILVLGTNGKGSTAAMLAAVLQAHGLSVGLYTSPHLVRVHERIRIDGAPVRGVELERVLELLDCFPELSFFETLTVTAFMLFAEAAVDVAVLEAGIGGRWDATRLADPVIAGLTNVGTDHARWLGSSREAIAAEKGAGLGAARLPVVGLGVDPSLEALLGVPQAHRATAMARVERSSEGRLRLSWGAEHVDLTSPLAGVHQLDNLHLALALAVAAVDEGILPGLRPAAVREGLTRTIWPGRLSWLCVAGRRVLVDGAHNLEAARALADHLARLRHPPDLVFSCLADKPAADMLDLLRLVVGQVFLIELEDDRAASLSDLRRAAPWATPVESLEVALRHAKDPVVAAGSLRLVGRLMEYAERGVA